MHPPQAATAQPAPTLSSIPSPLPQSPSSSLRTPHPSVQSSNAVTLTGFSDSAHTLVTICDPMAYLWIFLFYTGPWSPLDTQPITEYQTRHRSSKSVS